MDRAGCQAASHVSHGWTVTTHNLGSTLQSDSRTLRGLLEGQQQNFLGPVTETITPIRQARLGKAIANFPLAFLTVLALPAVAN